MSPALLFRNVDVVESDPVEQWPAEAIATALERGSLRHWSRIVTAIRHDPWGPVARCVEEFLSSTEVYGVGPTMSRAIRRAREEQGTRERQEVAAELGRLVAASGFTAAECASRLGTSGSRLSTYLAGKVVPSAAFAMRARSLLTPPA